MNAYFDTGILVKLFYTEPNSEAAIALVRAEPAPLPLTHFQESELRNTFRLKVFRREVSGSACQQAMANLEHDLAAGIFLRPIYSLAAVFHKAEALSSMYATSTGARTIDTLHVAAALEIGCKRFVSFDQRQRKVAAKAGLRVVPR